MTEGLDAAILAAIEEWRDVWREVGRLDDEDPAIGNTAERAIRLERKTARMPAMTPEGYHAKVEVIRKAEFDGDVLPALYTSSPQPRSVRHQPRPRPKPSAQVQPCAATRHLIMFASPLAQRRRCGMTLRWLASVV